MVQAIESTRLEALESEIQQGITGFYRVGRALKEIKDTQLYRELGYTSFEAYCNERWQISKSRAHQFLSASQLIESSTMVDDSGDPENTALKISGLGLSERSLRPITDSGLPEQQKTKILETVVSEASETGDKVTAAKTQKAVEEVKYQGNLVAVVSKDSDGVIEAEDSEGNYMVFHSSEVTPVEPVKERAIDVSTTTNGDCFEELEVCEIRCNLLEDVLRRLIAWFDAEATLDKDGAIRQDGLQIASLVQQARELIE
ncbi:MAG: hypothetical protein AAGA75_09140 [Cyanobacteria bacterium P01_E01_bin.6]